MTKEKKHSNRPPMTAEEKEEARITREEYPRGKQAPAKLIPFQKILDAKIAILNGKSEAQAAKELSLTVLTMRDRIARLDEVMSSNTPALTVERQIISEALSDKLKPIKEELSLKSLEIIRKADQIVLERLQLSPEDVSTKDVLRAAEQHSQRLARITGLEEAPEVDPASAAIDRAKTINVFVNTTFKNHLDKLKDERKTTNTVDLTPIYVEDNDKEDDASSNYEENNENNKE